VELELLPHLLPDSIVVRDDVHADLDTLVADENGRTCNELADVVLLLRAERTAERRFRFPPLGFTTPFAKHA
jgi:hypothetical protein